MEDGIDADVLMDYVEFQIFPSQNRYESHICYGNKLVTAASGLLEQLILHSPKIKSLHSKGSDANFRFRPLGNLSDAKWFTKSTLIRYTQPSYTSNCLLNFFSELPYPHTSIPVFPGFFVLSAHHL